VRCAMVTKEELAVIDIENELDLASVNGH